MQCHLPSQLRDIDFECHSEKNRQKSSITYRYTGNIVNGIIVAFQRASPNSRAAHPGQESPGGEGKGSVISVFLKPQESQHYP